VDYVIPDFAKREISPEAPFAQVSAMLNALLILVLAPLCGVLMQRVSAFRAITIGSVISAASVFFLALPPAMFQPLADGWLGDWIVHRWLNVAGPVNPLYISIFLFTVGLSIGEALWSPRLYEYAAAIAPKGREASYMAMTSLPYFFAKCGAGFLSGWLLVNYCPETGARHPQTMWLIVGGMALVTPLGAILFRKYIQVHEAGR
jgi:MFS family permease